MSFIPIAIGGEVVSGLITLVLGIALFPLTWKLELSKIIPTIKSWSKAKRITIGSCVGAFLVIPCLIGTVKSITNKPDVETVSEPITTTTITTTISTTTPEATTTTKSTTTTTLATTTTVETTIPTITETEIATYSIDLNDIYNYVEEGMLYNDVLAYVKSTGLPYKELSYLRAWTIKVAYTSGAIVDKHSEDGDYVVINFDLPNDISSEQNKNDYILTSIKKFSQETLQSTEKEFTTTSPVITTIMETEPPQTFSPITEAPKAVVQSYVLNTSTMKVHKSTCRDVDKIVMENYAECNDLQWAFDNGYSPCGHCNP